MNTYIIVRSQFVGFHRWPSAPIEVSFLRNIHRHVFHVEAKLSVGSDDREKEFFIVKNKLNCILWALERGIMHPRTEASLSCETIAKEIMGSLNDTVGDVVSVSVFEDGENGAEVSI